MKKILLLFLLMISFAFVVSCDSDHKNNFELSELNDCISDFYYDENYRKEISFLDFETLVLENYASFSQELEYTKVPILKLISSQGWIEHTSYTYTDLNDGIYSDLILASILDMSFSFLTPDFKCHLYLKTHQYELNSGLIYKFAKYGNGFEYVANIYNKDYASSNIELLGTFYFDNSGNYSQKEIEFIFDTMIIDININIGD